MPHSLPFASLLGLPHNREDHPDPWDGRISKELNFINKIKERFPMVVVKNLTPIMDNMRWIKDEKEIAVIRTSPLYQAWCLTLNQLLRIRS